MKVRRTTTYLLIDIAIAALFLLETVSGFVLMFVLDGGYQGGRNVDFGRAFIFSREAWLDLHDWGGLLMAALVLTHVIMHWRWIVGVARSYGRRFYRTERARGSIGA